MYYYCIIDQEKIHYSEDCYDDPNLYFSHAWSIFICETN